MKPNKWQREADKTLKEFKVALKQTQRQVVKIKHRMTGLAILPLVMIPLIIGYALFKKPRLQAAAVLTESESSHQQLIQKQPAFPWLSSIVKEICIVIIGKMASNFLQKS
jgi:hypothetical protein